MKKIMHFVAVSVVIIFITGCQKNSEEIAPTAKNEPQITYYFKGESYFSDGIISSSTSQNSKSGPFDIDQLLQRKGLSLFYPSDKNNAVFVFDNVDEQDAFLLERFKKLPAYSRKDNSFARTNSYAEPDLATFKDHAFGGYWYPLNVTDNIYPIFLNCTGGCYYEGIKDFTDLEDAGSVYNIDNSISSVRFHNFDETYYMYVILFDHPNWDTSDTRTWEIAPGASVEHSNFAFKSIKFNDRVSSAAWGWGGAPILPHNKNVNY